MIEPTVTIGIQEYDALRKTYESVNSGETYLKYEYMYGNTWIVTNDKTKVIIDLAKEAESLKQQVRTLESKLKDYESGALKPVKNSSIFSRLNYDR